MSDRQVIFVGGTSYSGSTMLDMMLANGQGGFSCGEVAAAFSPYRRHHLAFHEHAAGDGSTPWRAIIDAGSNNLYRNIFDLDSGISRIIDSSKDPIWIADQMRALDAQGIRYHNVIIWKRPVEFLASMAKRGREHGWHRAWVNYHKTWFRLVPEWLSVAYGELVTGESSLRRLCALLDVAWFDGKEAYWEGSVQTLFGNDSAKVHLDDSAERADQAGESRPSGKHRRIYYEAPDAATSSVDDVEPNPDIIRILRARDALTESRTKAAELVIPSSLKTGRTKIQLKRLKRRLIGLRYGIAAKTA